jgi:hypothetical protein
MGRVTGLITALTQLLRSSDSEVPAASPSPFPILTAHQVQRCATGACANLACFPGNQAPLAQHPGVLQVQSQRRLATFLVSFIPIQSLFMLASGKEESETARYAALTIANIACDSANQEKIVMDGGGTMLVRLLRSSDSDLSRHSARALANLAWNSVCRDRLGSQTNCISVSYAVQS